MSLSLLVLIPTFNDWQSIEPLLRNIDVAALNLNWACDVLMVDDGSTDPIDPALNSPSYRGLRSVRILRLGRNLGHQRAIAIGLVYVQQQERPDAVLVMDGDGEDKPEDIPRLLGVLEKQRHEKVVFAARTKRLESLTFRFFYRLYRLLHLLLTGVPVRIGNFSVIPAQYLPNIVISSDLWNHYAAAVMRLNIPITSIPIPRGERLKGRSKMNFYSLAMHGLSGISVFIDRVGVRLLSVTAAVGILSLGLLVVVLAVRWFTELAIPGWATFTAGLLILIILQMMLLAAVLVFLVMHSRSATSFLPVRDSAYFISSVRKIYPAS